MPAADNRATICRIRSVLCWLRRAANGDQAANTGMGKAAAPRNCIVSAACARILARCVPMASIVTNVSPPALQRRAHTAKMTFAAAAPGSLNARRVSTSRTTVINSPAVYPTKATAKRSPLRNSCTLLLRIIAPVASVQYSRANVDYGV
jgi:hypothetical protein